MTKADKKQEAITLVDSWLADPSGYDQRVWLRLKRAIEANRLSSRRRFKPASQRS